jgi:hypothetical protein
MSIPVIVPETTVPFFNSIVTDSLLSFIKNLKIKIVIQKNITYVDKLLNIDLTELVSL